MIVDRPATVSATWRETVAGFGGRSHWVDLDGPLHYVEFTPEGPDADLPDIVLVHGLGGSFVEWLALAPLLARRHRVLAFDLPGHGLTPAAGRHLGLDGLQALLNRFLLVTGAQRPLVVGNSLGGTLAARHASSWPGAARGVVLVDPVLPVTGRVRPHPLVLAGFATYAVPAIGRRVLGRRRTLLSPERLIEETLALCCASPDRVPDDVRAAAVRMARHRRQWPPDDGAFLAAARDIVRQVFRPHDYRRLLAAIEVPVLLIHGDRDHFVPVAAAHRIADRTPAWRHEILPGAGHLPQLEDPGGVLERITAWWSGQAAPAAERTRPA